MKHIEANDPDVHRLILREEERQACSLTLIASENHSSKAVREAMASHLTDKYAEGYPGRRYYGGCEVGDDVERPVSVPFGLEEGLSGPGLCYTTATDADGS